MKLYQRSKLKQTASALNGSPSWNVTPSWSVNVQVRPSSLASQLVGEAGLELGRARLQRDERLEDLVDHAQRLAVGDERAVEHDRVGRRAEDERAARRAALGLGRRAVTAALVVVATAARREARAWPTTSSSKSLCHFPLKMSPFNPAPPGSAG